MTGAEDGTVTGMAAKGAIAKDPSLIGVVVGSVGGVLLGAAGLC